MTQAIRSADIVQAEARRAPRDLVDFGTSATTRTGTYDVRIVNISPLGLMARSSGRITKGEKLLFALPHIRTIEAEVRWAEEGRIGIEFAQPIPADHYAMMLAFMPQRQMGW